MVRQKTIFVCQNCGGQSPKWVGKCPDCQAWNTMVEELTQSTKPGKGIGLLASQIGEISSLESIESSQKPRTITGIPEFDRVVGGGIVDGSFILLGGEPGIGKSTIVLQVIWKLAHSGKNVLYVSGEESVEQTSMRAHRLGVSSKNIKLGCETDLDVILESVKKYDPQVLIVDSIQTVSTSQVQSAPGSVSQVRECAARLMHLAKTKNITVFVIGHVTKDGAIAGPKVLEHMVDVVLSFEGDNSHQYRILRGLKNRFGPSQEIGVFEMSSLGLKEVANPSEMFLTERSVAAPGSCVFPTVEGTRTLLVEVQALATRSPMPMPRRTSLGIDINRLHLLLAILDKHLRLDLYSHDVFVNIVGGIKIQEPSADLAVAASLLSSLKNSPLPADTCFMGELGLTGEVRPIQFCENRVKEALKLGFKKFYLPVKNKKQLDELKSSGQFVFIQNISELRGLFKESPRHESPKQSLEISY